MLDLHSHLPAHQATVAAAQDPLVLRSLAGDAYSIPEWWTYASPTSCGAARELISTVLSPTKMWAKFDGVLEKPSLLTNICEGDGVDLRPLLFEGQRQRQRQRQSQPQGQGQGQEQETLLSSLASVVAHPEELVNPLYRNTFSQFNSKVLGGAGLKHGFTHITRVTGAAPLAMVVLWSCMY